MKPILGLHIPRQDSTRKPSIPLRVDRLQAWTETLPKLNFKESTAAVMAMLADINQTTLSPQQRFALLEVLVDDVNSLIHALRAQSASLYLPMPAAKRETYDRVQALLDSMAGGYKSVAVELIRGDAQVDAAKTHMRDALLRAVSYLSYRILLSYSVYEPPPDECWGELHRIFAFAEQKHFEGVRVEHLADQSIGDAYLRILLLGLANPYHLMHGEASEVYDQLRKWSLAARLDDPLEQKTASLQDGEFYVDLANDAPPLALLNHELDSEETSRRIHTREVVKILAERIKKLSLEKRLDIRQRLHRDLLRRLRNAWTVRQTRKDERKPQTGDAVAAIGLNACHHYLSGEKDFAPEQSEIELHGDRFQRKQELSLIPMDQESWKETETQEKLAKGVLKPRAYGFDVDDKEDDVWKKAIATGAAQKTGLESSVEERLLKTLVILNYRDGSEGGIGLEFTADHSIYLRVGELLMTQVKDEANCRRCELHAIRWLFYNKEKHRIQLGVSSIGTGCSAVAVRGLHGEGAETSYLRAIRHEEDDQSSIIVTTGRFDVGSRLLVNTGDRLQVFELQRLLQTSKSFSHFLIQPVTTDSETEEQAIQSLYRLLG